jgi:hypothetical protein
MRMSVAVFVGMRMTMLMGMLVFMFMIVRMLVIVRQMHRKLHARDVILLTAFGVQMVTVEPQFLQLVFELVRIEAQVNHRAEEHVAAQAAENIQVKGFHDAFAKLSN